MRNAGGIAHWMTGALIVIAATALLLLAWLWPRYPFADAAPSALLAERIGTEPLIHRDMAPGAARILAEHGHVNVNGATVIRVPAWIEAPANALRDSYVLDDNGRLLLFHSGAAEQAIGLAELRAVSGE